jgi:hypothetical protein
VWPVNVQVPTGRHPTVMGRPARLPRSVTGTPDNCADHGIGDTRHPSFRMPARGALRPECLQPLVRPDHDTTTGFGRLKTAGGANVSRADDPWASTPALGGAAASLTAAALSDPRRRRGHLDRVSISNIGLIGRSPQWLIGQSIGRTARSAFARPESRRCRRQVRLSPVRRPWRCRRADAAFSR